jgi:hypothetical protein
MKTKDLTKLQTIYGLLGVKVFNHAKEIDNGYLIPTMFRCPTCNTVFDPKGARKRYYCPNGCNHGKALSRVRMTPEPRLMSEEAEKGAA